MNAVWRLASSDSGEKGSSMVVCRRFDMSYVVVGVKLSMMRELIVRV